MLLATAQNSFVFFSVFLLMSFFWSRIQFRTPAFHCLSSFVSSHLWWVFRLSLSSVPWHFWNTDQMLGACPSVWTCLGCSRLRLCFVGKGAGVRHPSQGIINNMRCWYVNSDPLVEVASAQFLYWRVMIFFPLKRWDLLVRYFWDFAHILFISKRLPINFSIHRWFCL